jgi:probable F420-dependent oxidoreductase
MNTPTTYAPKFGIFGANTPSSMSTGADVANMARLAEDLGIESLWAAEHTVVPGTYSSHYPYDPSGKMADDHFPDPFVWLAYAAATTTRIKLATGVTVLPLRNPLIAAKQLATLATLSDNRLILGVGTGWLEEEFEALGVPFAGRGRRHDDHLAAMRALWAHDLTSVDTNTVSFGNVVSEPKPPARTIPIVVSGSSSAAVRRAARIGDGFFPGTSDPHTLQQLLDDLRRECVLLERDHTEIEVTVLASGYTPDDIARGAGQLVDAGAHRILLTPREEPALRDLMHTLQRHFSGIDPT